MANKNSLYSIVAVVFLLLILLVGVQGLGWYLLFGVLIPYVAVVFFIVGFVYQVLRWASSPVPFHIPTVCGQQKSLPWIKADKMDSPQTTGGVVARLALDILFFRPLLKNDRIELQEPQKLLFKTSTYLWLGALAFHWSCLIILLRHSRFFLEPVPSVVLWLQWFDGIFQGLLPILYATDLIILLALSYLFIRRVVYPQIRYISLPSDYFVPLLILGIVVSGILMRLVYRVDLMQVKAWVMSMLSFHPTLPKGVNLLFYIHLFFVCLLIAYFPLSKLMHMPGIFLSPTRNLRNVSRSERHINPWDRPVKVHTYQEYEDEFREAMKEVGLPLEKD
ncbi:MAG: menaquinol oxidoreductase [Deltaproteobacteria bacterium]|nr:menaquinol oxidoreductase [Deltaproteobacteria bacterium]